jgi:hypothetical protein
MPSEKHLEMDLFDHDVEQIQKMMDLKIDSSYLMREAGETDLEFIENLNIVVDTKYQSLYDISYYLVNLKSLILDRSYIGNNIRDFGIAFNNLVHLSMNECQLYDLEGISCLSLLKDISLSDNFIFDVTPLSQLEFIEVINYVGMN